MPVQKGKGIVIGVTDFCKNCIYFKSDELQCRRNPPADTVPRWPKTMYSDWCGEFKAAEDTRQAKLPVLPVGRAS